LRPHVDKLRKLHRFCVSQNDPRQFDYIERECVLPSIEQKEGFNRGRNIIQEFNLVYTKHKNNYRYICKWDDDIILPPNILNKTRQTIIENNAIGAGLFCVDYGRPTILMTNKYKDGFHGAFQRFYIYRMENWGKVPLLQRGDPDQPFQRTLKGRKTILTSRVIHLDHRACPPTNNHALYSVILDLASWMVTQKK